MNQIMPCNIKIVMRYYTNINIRFFVEELPIGRMKNRYAKHSFSLWHLAHIRGSPFQKVSHDLIKLRGVLWGDDRRIGL